MRPANSGIQCLRWLRKCRDSLRHVDQHVLAAAPATLWLPQAVMGLVICVAICSIAKGTDRWGQRVADQGRFFARGRSNASLRISAFHGLASEQGFKLAHAVFKATRRNLEALTRSIHHALVSTQGSNTALGGESAPTNRLAATPRRRATAEMLSPLWKLLTYASRQLVASSIRFGLFLLPAPADSVYPALPFAAGPGRRPASHDAARPRDTGLRGSNEFNNWAGIIMENLFGPP